MYKSPITVNMMDEMTQFFIEQTEGGIVGKVREVIQIDIDKDELIKALKYDRYQYERGYAHGRMDGHASGYKERDDEIVRCGECKWLTEITDYNGWCPHINDHIENFDWFCADGERKDNETKLKGDNHEKEM